MTTKHEQRKPQNPVALLRERFRKIKEDRKPSKEVEETFIPEKSAKLGSRTAIRSRNDH